MNRVKQVPGRVVRVFSHRGTIVVKSIRPSTSSINSNYISTSALNYKILKSPLQSHISITTAGSTALIPVPTLSTQNENDASTWIMRRWFSFERNSSSYNDHNSKGTLNLGGMSPDQLCQLAAQFCRQDNPHQAQRILEKLLEEKGPDVESEKDIDLESLKTNIIDAWIKHQSRVIRQFKAYLMVRNGNDVDSNITHDEAIMFLEDIVEAARCASDVLEIMRNPSSHHYIAALKAWANTCEAASEASLSKLDLVSGIPQRAQYILSQHHQPAVEAVNQVIKAWAYSGEHLRGTMADEVFKVAREPNGETFKLTMRAWCSSRERRSAFAATGYFLRMMKMFELGRADMQPSMDDYYILFDAWTSARDVNAPSKVQVLLSVIEDAYQKGRTRSRADERCFRDALITISGQSSAPNVGELADKVLAEMKERMFVPDTACYGAAILAWKNVATNHGTEDREPAVKRALDLLREMTKAYHRTILVTVKPTTENYNNVLEALTVSKNAKALDHATILLNALEDSYPDSSSEGLGSVSVGPNAKSYAHVLHILRNQKSSNKVNQAADLMKRIKIRMDHIRVFSKERDIIDMFNEFIRVCGSTEPTTDSTRAKIMEMSLRITEEMESLDLQPNSGTYTALLEVCQKLLQPGGERQRILEKIFGKACDEGYVDKDLLARYKCAASSHSYAKLVVANSVQVENIKALPEAWARNAGGRAKLFPLSIDGKFTFTKSEADYRMRKLRKRTNKKVLQGGRRS